MIYPYNRRLSLEYARRWAYRRNPLFFDFTGSGGNCTNFVSQCILAGCCTMNFTETFGWYYISPEDRAPAWTGVEFLFNFLTSNEASGPFGVAADVEELEIGDVIQLADESGDYYHTLLVSGFENGNILVAAQSNDAFDRPLDTYDYATARGIHVSAYRRDSERCRCFADLYRGVDLRNCLNS